ncbi:MAG: hypothetical protein ABIP36_03040 [Acidimicrobiales bacterium]
MGWRAPVAVICAAAAAALGALILGEYELTGTLPYAAGPLFGLAIAEVVVGIGRTRAVTMGIGSGALASGGIAWAGWIDSSQGLEPVRGTVWMAAGLAAVTALLRTTGLPRRRPVPR